MNPSRFSNQLLRIATRLFPSSRRSRRDSLSSQSSTDSQTSQQISAWDIDPKKLADHLTSAFEPNSFQIDLVHNNYIIRAPRTLSKRELQRCR
ncbi:uncharacterized protein B0J16DRAFT_348394 [Fusarium flagelliforme]|uniref:uncharacterized protein n=1 Tax=Fusarium flagelliforme TaxID=2675880 RepID=UPI001E8D3026|nr:uncharacterized protein B0J16DRAFT_348394 [Fusarium flagelliforme]KAH7174294.1 hypothetical protein B0J16DRAFT_348394 [Fusarium flagelliforme]